MSGRVGVGRGGRLRGGPAAGGLGGGALPRLREEGGSGAGEDSHPAFARERVDRGTRRGSTKNVTRVVGGTPPACTEAAAKLYGSAIDAVHPVSSPEAAELSKLLEN